MNIFLLKYQKRDNWFNDGKNFGLFLRERQTLIEAGMSKKKADKQLKRYIWSKLI